MNLSAALTPFLALSIALAAPASADETPRASVSEPSFAFGTVKQGTPVTHVFVVRNEGSVPLRIERVDLALPGLTARFKPEVPAGGEGRVTIAWATEHVNGPIEAEARVATNDPAHRTLVLTLAGTVEAPISIGPLPAAFVSVFAGETGESALTVESHEERPLALPRLEPHGEHFTASIAAVRDGRAYRLTVHVPSTTPAGRYDESLTLLTDSAARPRIEIPVHLFVKRDVYANPETVDYGDLPLATVAASPGAGELLAQTFLVKRRKGSFEITSIRCDDPAVSLEVSPPADVASDTYRVDVRLRPAALRKGALDTAIRIGTSDPRFPSLVVPVRARVL